jgi:hypothetical protein
MSLPNMEGPTSARSGALAGLVCGVAVFVLMCLPYRVGRRSRANKKPTTEFGRGVVVEIRFLRATSSHGVVGYDDDRQQNLSRDQNHWAKP